MVKKQLNLFDGTVQTREIKKHSSLVQMGNITTLWERKSLNALIYIAKDALKRNQDQRVFTCDLGTIKRLTGWDNTNINNLKQAIRNLQEISIEYNIMGKDNVEEWGIFSVLSEAKIRVEGRGKSSTVSFEFPTTVLNAIKNPRIYVKLNLLILRGFSSKHSLALYEFLSDYLNIQSYRCSTEEFRHLMGIEAGQYEYFTMLRKRVLDVAIEEINEKSDISVSYDVEKEGRKYAYIIFSMQRKEEALDERNVESAIRDKLKSFGLGDKTIDQLLERHDEAYLRVNISVVEEQYKKGKVKNLAGYLLQAFEDDYSNQKSSIPTYQEEKELIIEAEEEQENRKKEFERERNQEALKYLKSLSPQEEEEMRNAFFSDSVDNLWLQKLIEKNEFSHPAIQAVYYQWIAKNKLGTEWHSFDSFQALRAEEQGTDIS